jgi:predicted AAA+ superfamily ATPase
MQSTYRRPHMATLVARLREPRRRMQVLIGPRQVGKSTLIGQAIEELACPHVSVSADEIGQQPVGWIATHWEAARSLLKSSSAAEPVVLVLDEVQKLPNWSETVKRLWDEDTRNRVPLHVVLLGSSPLLMQAGLTESMAGRFEVVHVPHWSLEEMTDAFGFTLDEYLYFGGYPGGVDLRGDVDRWKNYVRDVLVETTIARDVLLMKRIDKPALMRQLAGLATSYSGQAVSFTKMLGQLQNQGNSTIIADYLHLLGSVGMVSGLQKYSPRLVRQRASSPKLQVWNTALLSAASSHTFQSAREDSVFWGHLCESAVGAHLLNSTRGTRMEVLYWSKGDLELDFVLVRDTAIIGIEVKSGSRSRARGLEAFLQTEPKARGVVVGEGGRSLLEFLRMSAFEFF